MDKIKSLLSKVYEHKFFTLIALVVLIILGLLVRISLLNTDLWYDELFTAIVVREDWPKMFDLIIVDKVHPPTYYIFQKLWSSIFGYSANGIRSFEVFLGVLLIPLSYYISKLLVNTKEKLFPLSVSLFIAFSPFLIAYSAEARSYMFLACLGILTLGVFLKLVNSGRLLTKDNFKKNLKLWMSFFSLLLLIILTHYLSLLIVPGFLFAFIILGIYEMGWNTIKNFWIYFWSSIASLFLIIVSLFQYFYLYDLVSRLNTTWIPKTSLLTIFQSVTSFLFGVARQERGVPPYLSFENGFDNINIGFIVLIVSIVFFVKVWIEVRGRKDNVTFKNLIVLTSVTFIPLTLFFLTSTFGLNTYVERYAIIYSVYFVLWLSYIWYLSLNKWYYVILVVYIFSTVFLVPAKTLTVYTDLKQNLDIATQEVKVDKIIFHDPVDFISMKYYRSSPQSLHFFVQPGSDYSSWALIERKDEVSDVEFCNEDCLYVINNERLSEGILEEGNPLILRGRNFSVYLVK